jgi:uncharacterized protein (DUF924 family)
MIRLETNPVCPAGLTAATALEHLGEPYVLAVLKEGDFLQRHGAAGPRTIDGERVLWSREAVADLLGRCLRGASAETHSVAAHVRNVVVPSLLANDLTGLRGALAALGPLLDQVPPAEATLLVPLQVPLARALERVGRAQFPSLAERSDALAASPALARARERIAAGYVATPEEVLAFWFGAPIASEDDAMVRLRRWFRCDEAFDADLRARFLGTIEAALRGELDGWARSMDGRLALVLVLDQMTRNAFRGTPRAWSGDERALALATEALDVGLDASLPLERRFFLGMPLLHAENLPAQERSHARALTLRPLAARELRRMAEGHVEQSAKYLDVISRFGRFPFRNAVLGRVSTPEETSFLATFVAPPAVMRSQVRV